MSILKEKAKGSGFDILTIMTFAGKFRGLWHAVLVSVRGDHRPITVRTSADYQAYLERLGRYGSLCQVRLWVYCLMPNHVHLLVEPGKHLLSLLMQRLQQSYTPYFNRTHRKVGHLFQGRYHAIVCGHDPYRLTLIRSIHLKPVRAKLVTQPDAYVYSGHRTYLTGVATAVFGGVMAYRQFIQAGLGEGHQAEYYAVADQRFLGTTRFVDEWQACRIDESSARSRLSLTRALQMVATG